MNKSRKIVFGLGNTLNRDEGLGVYALKVLETALAALKTDGQAASQDIELLDGGVLGLNLLPWVEESSHLLILDAVSANKAPGAIVELSKQEIPLYSGIKMSDHQVTFQEVLGIAQFRNRLPQNLHLIGAQPADISIGVDLSVEVQNAIPQIVRRAISQLESWDLI